MTDTDLIWRFEPVDLSPVDPGWRAVLLDFDSEGHPAGMRVEPLMSWGLFHVTIHSATTGELLFDHGNLIEGVIADTDPVGGASFPACAQNFGLALYLGPTAQAPTDISDVFEQHNRQRDQRLMPPGLRKGAAV